MEKERRTKALLLSALVVVVATLSIAFAAVSRTLNINGIGKMDTASWSVYFDNLSDAIANGAKEEGKPNINTNDKGIIENINVKLFKPGDEISYTVDIVNDGTIDAEITMIKDVELTDIQKKVFEFIVTYTDTGEVLKDGDILPKKTTNNATITIRFKDNITEADLPTEQQIINLSYQITYTQYDGGNDTPDLPIGPNGGGVTTGNSILSSADAEIIFDSDYPEETTFFNGTLQRGKVESITFLNSNIVPAEYADNAWDASQNNDRSVMAWHTPGDTADLYKVYIGANGGVSAPENSMALFACFIEMKELNFNGNFDTSNTTDTSFMFWSNTSLTTLDLTGFNTSNVQSMMYMFAYNSFTSLDLTSFDTSNVTDMSYMFTSCESLETLTLTSFDTRKVTTMEAMFSMCNSLTNLNLSSFYTPALENIMSLFEETKVQNLTVDLRNANFSKVTEYNGIFSKTGSSNFTIIVGESQKDLASGIFVAAIQDATVTIKTPSEL